jgi:carboxymethylenebutenolidase
MASEPAGPDLGRVFDTHVASEFESKDLEATMATMIDEPYVTHLPTLAGGVGAAEVRRFYDAHFIGHWPDDVAITHVSRTVGDDRVVDEMVMHFTHDRVMDTFLPGMAPTGRPVRLPVVVVAGFQDGKVAYEHIYWDQASLLVQVGALDASNLPVSGNEQAAKLLDKDRPCNGLIERAASHRPVPEIDERSGALARSGFSHVGTVPGTADLYQEGHGADERIRTSTPEGTGT